MRDVSLRGKHPPENRTRYERKHLRYPSDVTDAEWALIEPRIPPAKRGANKRSVNVREIVNGLMHILSTGCQWRAIPKDLPPRSTLYDYFDLWSWDGTLDRIHPRCMSNVANEMSASHGSGRSRAGSRAASTAVPNTRQMMDLADTPRQGDLDGRGNLSLKALTGIYAVSASSGRSGCKSLENSRSEPT